MANYTKDLKDRANKRKIAYIYLMHRMFEGNPRKMLDILRTGKVITPDDLNDWDLDYRDAVYATIQEEDSRGVTLKDKDDVPSIKSIKDKILRRCNALIESTEDPAKIAQVYKILSEFQDADEKKEQSVIDAINESVKPLTPKKKEKLLTMQEKMASEAALSESATGKRRGRPRKSEQQSSLPPLFGAPAAETPTENFEEDNDETIQED